MLGSSFFPLFAGVALVIGGACFFRCLSSWKTALHALVVVVCFGGWLSVNLGSGAYAILFRDVFIVLPLYIGLLPKAEGQFALRRMPVDLAAMLTLLVVVMFACTFNPVDVTLGEIAIGLKVWLFYIPFVIVGIALAAEPEAMLGFFRQILRWGFVACLIGLGQSLLVRFVGYERVMGWFFGANAFKVTQDFTMFDVAGGIYRMPGTFSFASQYANFLYLYLIVAAIGANIDPDDRLRRLARFGIVLATVCGVLSGARVAILIFPAILLIFAGSGLLNLRTMLLAPVGIIVGVVVISLSGLDLIDYFFVGKDLAVSYSSSSGFIVGQLEAGLDFGMLGHGIGSSTTAARYAMGLTAPQEVTGSVGLESYYGKAGVELGWLGFVTVALLMASVMLRAVWTSFKYLQQGERLVIIPLAVYLALVIVTSVKGSPLDADPTNIFFWLCLGLMIGVDRFRLAQSTAGDEVYAVDGEADEVWAATSGELLPPGE